MSLQEKAWWAQCIASNRYRYNFGRQANRTLASLELPDGVPEWVRSAPVPTFKGKNSAQPLVLDTRLWREFRIGDLFELRRGRNVVKREMSPGSTAFVSASSADNGITAWINLAPDFTGGQITINSNGSVGEAFYQPYPFIASGDVTVLLPNRPMSPAAALFFCTLARADKYRWNYGRKWGLTKIRESVVKLPTTPTGNPDWDFAERYIRSLPLAAAALDLPD
ncbi:restriction endonuclease subunit S [Melissospora conviva]|uniref:restriction endonuclease subunit S n=1 Tax=Melissospora conviva TaxID=3388432 RepID=UPI003B781CDF